MSVVTSTIRADGQIVDVSGYLLSIDIRREVNRIPYATLILLDGGTALDRYTMSTKAEFAPGKVLEINLRHEGGLDDTRQFKGVVMRHRVEQSARGVLLHLELKDAAVTMTQGRRTRVYPGATDAETLAQVIKTALGSSGQVGPAGEPAAATEHAQIVQYNSTDWDFVVSRAETNGWLAVVNDGVVSVRAAAVNAAPAVTLHVGISQIYDYELELDAESQYSAVTSAGWDIALESPAAPTNAAEFSLAQGDLTGSAIASDVGFDTFSLSHPVPLLTTELQAWANARLMRSRLSLIRGRVGTRGLSNLALLDTVEIAGVNGHFDGHALVTGIAHRVDREGWRTDVQLGLTSKTYAEEHELRDSPAAGQLPGVRGLQIGSVAGFADDPDQELRLQVTLPALATGSEPIWARVASPDAGKGRGYFFRPEVGDDVLVGFFNEDPRQPVVLGALFSSKSGPPSDCATLTEANTKKGIVTKAGTKILFDDADKPSLTIETAAHNRILLDDKNGVLQLSDQHGNKITMDDKGITIESFKDLTLKAADKIAIKGASVDLN
jgi:Rhs element Vgr protein